MVFTSGKNESKGDFKITATVTPGNISAFKAYWFVSARKE
jgi:hypothetical protein